MNEIQKFIQKKKNYLLSVASYCYLKLCIQEKLVLNHAYSSSFPDTNVFCFLGSLPVAKDLVIHWTHLQFNSSVSTALNHMKHLIVRHILLQPCCRLLIAMEWGKSNSFMHRKLKECSVLLLPLNHLLNYSTKTYHLYS